MFSLLLLDLIDVKLPSQIAITVSIFLFSIFVLISLGIGKHFWMTLEGHCFRLLLRRTNELNKF